MVPEAGIFPSELTALRAAGLLIAAAIVAYAVLRRRTLRNVDVLILLPPASAWRSSPGRS